MLANELVKEEAPTSSFEKSGWPSGRTVYWLLGVLVAYVLVRTIFSAATKPFWFDELITLSLSSLPNMKAVWQGLARALDGTPPGFYLIERPFVGLSADKEIGLRLPSILAFPCTLLCVFVYAKKRTGEVIAFLCTLFLLLTSLFLKYAVEARSYSLLIACIAFALICYQRVPSTWWTILLVISLAGAQTLHHYAVF